MLAELAVILTILLTIAFIYLKGTLVKAFVLLINTLISAILAFSYYETLGKLVIGYEFIPQWAFGAVLIVIFVFSIAILNAIADKLIKSELSFGETPDKAAKCIVAAIAGFAIAGIILTAAAMMPIGTKWPYQRYADKLSQSAEPQKKLILKADGFITSIVSLVSRGSMSGSKSLAVFHPSLLNEMYLARIGIEKYNSLVVAGQPSVQEAIAPPTILNKDKQPINLGAQTKPVIIKAVLDDRNYTLSQIRLICKNTDTAGNLTGSGQVFWPMGYLIDENTLDQRNLSDPSKIARVSLIFYIPSDTVPVLLEYKQNGIAQVGRLTVPQPAAPTETVTQPGFAQ